MAQAKEKIAQLILDLVDPRKDLHLCLAFYIYLNLFISEENLLSKIIDLQTCLQTIRKNIHLLYYLL
jgi:hypothetical protein